jgi:hypothetical protein
MDKQFYKNLKQFLKELIIVFPEDDEKLQILSTTINLAIIDDDDHKIIKKFYTSLSPLEENIYKRDISIFSSEISKYWPETSYEYRLFYKIQENWETFTEHNKSILWDYIIVLYTLSKKILNTT